MKRIDRRRIVIAGTAAAIPTGDAAGNVILQRILGGGSSLITPPNPAPVITSSLTSSGTVGLAFNYQIEAINSPTSFAAAGLPAGLSINTTSGLISGIPSTPTSSDVGLSATNDGGTGTATLVLTIAAAGTPPSITSPLTLSGAVGAALSYQITATNSPTSFNATGLPGGLGINTSTGLISGTPTTAATSNITINATNGAGTGPNATLVATISSSGTAIPITSYTQITGPGTYRLVADTPIDGDGVRGFMLLDVYSNVTLLGDGHRIGGLKVGATNGSLTGIVVQDLVCDNVNGYGNTVLTETAPAVHLNNVTTTYPQAVFAILTTGNNMLIENCHLQTDPVYCDDPLELKCWPSGDSFARWITVRNCVFGENYDLAIEGIGSWDHCTFEGNDCSPVGPFGGIGGWYGQGSFSLGLRFKLNNCTFLNNRIKTRYVFTDNGGGSLVFAFSDAEANANWGAFGNTFTGTIFV